MMLYLVNQEAADFLCMLKKKNTFKNLQFPIPQVQKSVPTFRSGRKSSRKDQANRIFKIINLTRYLVTLLTQSPNLK